MKSRFDVSVCTRFLDPEKNDGHGVLPQESREKSFFIFVFKCTRINQNLKVLFMSKRNENLSVFIMIERNNKFNNLRSLAK